MEKCTVRDPLLRLNKGWQIGATEEQLKVNGRIHLVKRTDKKNIFEVMVPFDLKEGEEIILNTALLPKELRLKMTGAAVEVKQSEDSEDEQPEDELNEPPEVKNEREQIKDELTALGVEFNKRASTEVLKKKLEDEKADPFTE